MQKLIDQLVNNGIEFELARALAHIAYCNSTLPDEVKQDIGLVGINALNKAVGLPILN